MWATINERDDACLFGFYLASSESSRATATITLNNIGDFDGDKTDRDGRPRSNTMTANDVILFFIRCVFFLLFLSPFPLLLFYSTFVLFCETERKLK